MRGFLSEVRANLRLPVSLAAWGFLTVMMALAGPFGSYETIPFAQRFVFWLAVTALALVLAVGLRVLVYSRLGLAGLWIGGMVTSGLVAAVLSWPLHFMMAHSTTVYPLLPPSPGELAAFIFCLTLGFCAFRHAIDQGSLTEVAPFAGPVPHAEQKTPARPRLVERLPPDVRGAVLRVSGRDHYVDVVTDAGVASLLMRFSDAVAELDGAAGLRVHRSHWVADHAVKGGTRDGTRILLHLVQGDPVPVSRTYLPEVERCGWLDQA